MLLIDAIPLLDIFKQNSITDIITIGDKTIRQHVYDAPTIDAVPVDIVADMLAYMFNDECPCNYNDIDEWLPYVCENTETCPDVVGKHSCWKQFIKHWMSRRSYHEA